MGKRGLNLLKSQVEPPTVWSKLYDWIVSTARIIVMIVELVVVVAFVVRLVVDVQSKRYDEEISDQEAIVGQFKDAETRYRKVQDKTKAFEQSWILSAVYTEIFTEINRYVPQNAQELNVQVDKDQIVISGLAPNSAVGQLETSLKNSEKLQGTEVKQIQSTSNNPNELAQFVITTKIKNIKARTMGGSAQGTN